MGRGEKIKLDKPERLRYIVLKPELLDGIYALLQGDPPPPLLENRLPNALRDDPPYRFLLYSNGIEITWSLPDRSDRHVVLRLKSDNRDMSGRLLIPADFLGPDVTPDSLPEIFHSGAFLTLDLTENPVYSVAGSERQMKFSQWVIDSTREQPMRGRYWMVPVTLLGDVGICAIAVAAVPVGLVIAAVVMPVMIVHAIVTGEGDKEKGTEKDKSIAPTESSPPASAPPASNRISIR